MFEHIARPVYYNDGRFLTVVLDFKDEKQNPGLVQITKIIGRNLNDAEYILKGLDDVIFDNKEYADAGVNEMALDIWKDKVLITDLVYCPGFRGSETYEIPTTEFYRLLKEWSIEYKKYEQ